MVYVTSGLGTNIDTRVPSTCVASEVLATSLASVIPNTVWPPVKQKSYVKVVNQNKEPRGRGCSLGVLGML